VVQEEPPKFVFLGRLVVVEHAYCLLFFVAGGITITSIDVSRICKIFTEYSLLTHQIAF